MRIGIDIDGVLTDLERYSVDYLSKYCVENNIDFNIGESDYEIYKTFNITKEQENDFWNQNLELYAKNEKARSFSSEVIKKLKEDGHEIYIVTARWLTNRDDEMGSNMRKLVKNWLFENEIIYDKLIFTRARKEQKHQEIRDNQIDLMIEDSPNNVNQLSSIVPVICFDAGYNRKCEGKNIMRCYSWYDIYRTINSLSKD